MELAPSVFVPILSVASGGAFDAARLRWWRNTPRSKPIDRDAQRGCRRGRLPRLAPLRGETQHHSAYDTSLSATQPRTCRRDGRARSDRPGQVAL